MSIGDIATVFGIFASLVAMIGLLFELRSSRLALQTQALLVLEERFYSQRVTELRKCAARNLLLNCTLNEELEDTLDFLHGVCMLVERGVVDRKLAVEFYRYWITRYWVAAQPYIKEVRRIDDPNTYTKFERFTRDIMRNSPGVNFSEEAMKVFLLKEAGISETEIQEPEFDQIRAAVDQWHVDRSA